jgi:4-amino-4-deoxy-L-arabinose transferase-like glycosyltransferase
VVQAAFLAWCVCHWLTLPLYIPFDGQQYLHYASLIGTDAFAAEWSAFRTPGFPLALAISFALFGRGALAAAAVPTALAALGVLLTAQSVRRIAGERAACAAVVVLALYPTSIAYQHAVLTETGTFFFLALLVRLLVWKPASPRADYTRAIALGAALAAGYLWRQTLLAVAPAVAVLTVLTSHRGATPRRRLANRALELAIVVAIPLATHAGWWSRFPLTEFSGSLLQTFALRQGLVPPTDPMVAPIAEEYRSALEQARVSGSHAGIYWPHASELFARIEAPPSSRAALVELAGRAARYPGRYLAALGRTLMLFAGWDGGRDESADVRNTVLAPWATGTVALYGPPELLERNRLDFARSTSPGIMRRALSALHPCYRLLLPLGISCAIALLLVGVRYRDTGLLTLAGIPCAFVLVHAALLMSIDRFVFPTYPLLLACGVVAAALLARQGVGTPGE